MRQPQRGFTLAELAIVTLILALLIGGTVLTFSAQSAAREVADTQRSLELARDALIGFALKNGRLPCPATAASSGEEVFSGAVGSSPCSVWIGALPVVTMGLSPVRVDPAAPARMYLADAWQNPIRYSVSPANTEAFVRTDQMKTTGFAALDPDLCVVFSTAMAAAVQAAGGTDAQKCRTGKGITTPAVIWSLGRNGSTLVAAGPDEAENLDPDKIFTTREANPTTTGGDYDDIVVWLPTNILYGRLIAAGAL
jgi:prepilin-type N-terminal cleavage/methylation domain-containing protein